MWEQKADPFLSTVPLFLDMSPSLTVPLKTHSRAKKYFMWQKNDR